MKPGPRTTIEQRLWDAVSALGSIYRATDDEWTRQRARAVLQAEMSSAEWTLFEEGGDIGPRPGGMPRDRYTPKEDRTDA